MRIDHYQPGEVLCTPGACTSRDLAIHRPGNPTVAPGPLLDADDRLRVARTDPNLRLN